MGGGGLRGRYNSCRIMQKRRRMPGGGGRGALKYSLREARRDERSYGVSWERCFWVQGESERERKGGGRMERKRGGWRGKGGWRGRTTFTEDAGILPYTARLSHLPYLSISSSLQPPLSFSSSLFLLSPSPTPPISSLPPHSMPLLAHRVSSESKL